LLIKGGRRKFWHSQWPEGEKRRSKKLGWCDEMTQSQAERAHRQHMEKVNCQRDAAGDAITLEAFLQRFYWDEESRQYLDELMTKKFSTRRDMKKVIRQIVIPRFGKRRRDSIKTCELQSFFASRIGHEDG
jgi:hypothetical protein